MESSAWPIPAYSPLRAWSPAGQELGPCGQGFQDQGRELPLHEEECRRRFQSTEPEQPQPHGGAPARAGGEELEGSRLGRAASLRAPEGKGAGSVSGWGPVTAGL